MDFEHATEEQLSREAAAQRLRDLADELARHNEVSFLRNGNRVTVDVADEVTFEFEVELEDGGAEIEVEISW